jgi:hypothetical protein
MKQLQLVCASKYTTVHIRWQNQKIAIIANQSCGMGIKTNYMQMKHGVTIGPERNLSLSLSVGRIAQQPTKIIASETFSSVASAASSDNNLSAFIFSRSP